MGRESSAVKPRKCKRCTFFATMTAADLREHVARRHGEAFKPKAFQKLNPDDIWDRPRFPGTRYAHRKTAAEREAYLRAKAGRLYVHLSSPGGER
jgi:hypothetical protein